MALTNIRMQPQETQKLSPRLAVIGVGGADGNAVNNMISSNLEGADFVVCNTDSQALQGSIAPNKLQLGKDVTGGLGAGARPEIGRAAAEESLEEVMALVDGANMVFITAGMGGGTGTGAAPIIARECRERGILTVGVVTKPFHFEGTYRMKMAEAGIEEMQQYVDTLIVIPNQNLFRIANEKTTFSEAFKMADTVLQSGVRGVTDLMIMPGMINLDFADVRSAMIDQGKAMLGTGEATGERRAVEAAESAINNPLLDDVSMKGAKGVIINITGGYDMTLFEADEACNRIRDEVDTDANIIFGSTFDEKMEGTMRVSVIATGIDQARVKKTTPTGGFDLNRAPIAKPPSATASKPKEPAAQSAQTAKSSETTKNEEPEETTGLFEQQTYTSPATPLPQNTALRGTRYNDSFIPPKPVEVDKNELDQPNVAVPTYTPQQTAPAETAPTTAHQPVAPQPTQAPVTQVAAPIPPKPTQEEELAAPKIGYHLNPPVVGEARAKKHTPTLFERITGIAAGLSDGVSGVRAPAKSAPMRPSAASNVGGGSPTQGSLAIDTPSVKPATQEENELDIPAFLRRQAN